MRNGKKHENLSTVSNQHGPSPLGGIVPTKTRKFMQTLDQRHYHELERIARKRGITVQQLIRAVIVPEYIAPEENIQETWKRARKLLLRGKAKA